MYDPVLYFLQACLTLILLIYVAASFIRGATATAEGGDGTAYVLGLSGFAMVVLVLVAMLNPQFHYLAATLLIGPHSLRVSPDILPGLQVGADAVGLILGFVAWCGTNPEAMNVRRGYY